MEASGRKERPKAERRVGGRRVEQLEKLPPRLQVRVPALGLLVYL
jgi:hypothetical protein